MNSVLIDGIKYESVEQYEMFRDACCKLSIKCDDLGNIQDLKNQVLTLGASMINLQHLRMFAVLFRALTKFQEFNSKIKLAYMDLFKCVFEKLTISNLTMFLNFFGLLLFELINKDNEIKQISEEYKLSIMECAISLMKALNVETTINLYKKEHIPKLSQLVLAALKLAVNEKYKTLQIAALNCIMAIGRVHDDNQFRDLEMRAHTGKVFYFVLPGVVVTIKNLTLVDEKYGHKVPTTAIKTWGRIVSMVMQDYSAAHQEQLDEPEIDTDVPESLRNRPELVAYLFKKERTQEWFLETDSRLKVFVAEMCKLSYHSHRLVRFELIQMASNIIEYCLFTMPKSICELVRVLIILNDDSEQEVANESKRVLNGLTERLQADNMNFLLEYFEEDFYKTITSIPRQFNGIDDREQRASLSVLLGYINLFGQYRLKEVLQSREFANGLISTLIYISEFDKTGISILEEYTVKDLKEDTGCATWRRFKYFTNQEILLKINKILRRLGELGVGRIILDFLLDAIVEDKEHRKEALYLLNQLVLGLEDELTNRSLTRLVMQTYLEHWNLALTVTLEKDETKHSLGEIQSNIIQACLLCEGVANMALTLKSQFCYNMLDIYLVVERAGSGHPLLKVAGMQTLSTIAKSLKHESVSVLLEKNMDYISFNLERKLKKVTQAEGALSVLTVLLQHSTMEGLDSKSTLISKLLDQLAEARKNDLILNAYLKVFKMFIQCVRKWLFIEDRQQRVKSRKEEEEESENFQVSDIDKNVNDFSDNIMGEKSAEELYKEDLAKSKQEIDNEYLETDVPEIKKLELPLVIKLTSDILHKTLHFLPLKDEFRKILVLEILKTGIEVLKDYENELLPIVHQIWLTLVDRFKEETNSLLIINYSFQLLVVLARLSKDFIRGRTVKEVLPTVTTILLKLAKKSYLKDKGSAYRYSQDYKLQLCLLENIAFVVTDLDMLQKDVDCVLETVFVYTSDKQPIPLQRAAIEFFSILLKYDLDPIKTKLESLYAKNADESEFEKNRIEIHKQFGE